MDLTKRLPGVFLSLLIVAGLIVGASVSSGYILVGDPATALGQTVSGEIHTPEVGVSTSESEPAEAPNMSVKYYNPR